MASEFRVLRPAVWGFYLIVVLEFLFMISPLAFHFYAAYGPVLNVLHSSPLTSWLTGFFLPHFSITTSPVLNSLKPIGFYTAAAGLGLFVVGAVQVYGAKLLRWGAVTGGLYKVVRHPQYTALGVLGLGVVLIWPRFLVLLSYLTMLFLYYLLAHWEERRCVESYGEPYREYQQRTGMLIPRFPGNRFGRAPRPPRMPHLRAVGLAFVSTLVAGYVFGFALRSFTLANLSAHYTENAAILSPAVLTDDALTTAYRLAQSHHELARQVTSLGSDAKLLVYVVPDAWYLPDLPLHSEEEIRRIRGGHRTPAAAGGRYRVLVTRARLHSATARGAQIVTRAFGLEPVLIVRVDIESRAVLEHREPPDNVIWGDIPTPLF